jgi:hypothetical protein
MGQGRAAGAVCLTNRGRACQGGQGRGRAVIFIIEHIKKTRIFLKKKKEK